jgi:hypothetical protein
MAILYGTQSNGETLPVLIDQYGNLIAKGIEGPQGPEGPPGVGELPPNPYEGAILGWQDGELAWLGGSVPLPAGTYGPYIYDPADQRLDIPQDASTLVNGQQLYMSDGNGIAISGQYSTDTISNVSILVPDQSGYQLLFPTSNNFDRFEVGDMVQSGDIYSQFGSGQTESDPTWDNWQNFFKFKTSPGADNLGVAVSGGELIWDYPFGLPVSGITTIWLTPGSGALFVTGQDGIEKEVDLAGLSGNVKVDITSLIGNTLYKFRFDSGGGGIIYMYGLEVDGSLITDGTSPSASITAIDESARSINVNGGSWYAKPPVGDGSGDPSGDIRISGPELSGIGSVFVGLEGAIVLRADNGEWIDNYYVTAPEQRIASRKVAANARKLRKK